MKTSAWSRNRDAGMVRMYAWVMAVTAVLTVAAALFATRTEPQYSASAEVLIDPTITPSGSYIQPSMPTEQRVATSADVINAAAERLEVPAAEALDRLEVTVPVDTQILVMSYTADTRREAWKGAAVVAQTFVKSRNPADGKNPVARLVGPPKMPTDPASTNYPVVLGVAILGGLLTGFAVAWIWDRVRGRIRTIGDAERSTGLEALAFLPRSTLRRSRGDPLNATGASHLDSLAARVLGELEDGPRPSLLVTGVGPECDSTSVAAQSALAMARMGCVVFLVTSNQTVIDRFSRGSVRKPARLHVVPVAEWDGEGVATASLTNMLPELRDRMPDALVVIDGPSAWQTAGMALRADKILLVATRGRSSRNAAAAGVHALDHCAEKLMGLVITSPRDRVGALLSSVRSWGAVRARGVISRVAPPEPSATVRHVPVTMLWNSTMVLRPLEKAATQSERGSRPGVLRAWNGMRGRDKLLLSATARDGVCEVGLVPVPHPGPQPTRWSTAP